MIEGWVSSLEEERREGLSSSDLMMEAMTVQAPPVVAEHLKEGMLPAACEESIVEVSWSNSAEMVKPRKRKQKHIVEVMRSLPDCTFHCCVVGCSAVEESAIMGPSHVSCWPSIRSSHMSSGSILVMQ